VAREAQSRRPGAGGRRYRTLACAAVVAIAAAAPAAAAGSGPPEALTFSVLLRTADLNLPAKGKVFGGVGLEVRPGWRQPFSGLEGTLTRVGVYGLQVSFSEQISLRVDGTLLERLDVDAAASRPQPGFDPDANARDVGTVRFGTVLRLLKQRRSRPAFGLEFAATLPTTDDQEGIGLDTTDVFATALWGLRRPRWEATGSFGVGILTSPTILREQNDVFTWGLKLAHALNGRWTILGEVQGYSATRGSVPRGTEDRSALRAGVAWRHPRVNCELMLAQGLTETEGDLGLGLALSWAWPRPQSGEPGGRD
jgi:hypothetical protein